MTIAFSIALSAFNALTLSPALAAKLLRNTDKPKRAPFRAVNRAIQWAHDSYGRVLQRILRHSVLIVGVFLAALALTVCAYRRVPSGFVPDEDQSVAADRRCRAPRSWRRSREPVCADGYADFVRVHRVTSPRRARRRNVTVTTVFLHMDWTLLG